MTDEMPMPKTVIITGASKGIGSAIAQKLAGPDSNLVLNYLTDSDAMTRIDALCRERGSATLVIRGDVGRTDTASTIVERATDTFGRVDALVNNAGTITEELVALLADEDLERMLSTNVAGVVKMSRAVLRPMMRARSGCIVNISSVLARQPGRGSAVYAGTKGFVEAFTRAMATELGSKGIRVNAVAPGTVETSMSQGVLKLAGETIKEKVALDRYGTAEEIAEVVCFLLSEKASYLNGAIVPVDGGYG